MKIKRYSVVTILIFDNDNDYSEVLLSTDDINDAMAFYTKEKEFAIGIDGYHIAVIDFVDNKQYQDGVWYHSDAKKRIEAEDLVDGLLVIDNEGNKGVIRDCSDLHNVHVIFEGDGMLIDIDGEEIECGGSSLYCFIEGCEEFSPNVDPLFFRDDYENR